MVNRMKKDDFLSRLCGGQGCVYCRFPGCRFLSRLCGGQAVLPWKVFIMAFLSRLCGGQEEQVAD